MDGNLDRGTSDYSQTLSIGHASPSKIPWRSLGQYKYRILEDGTQTQYRLAVIESLIPPHSDGPVFHFHEMHDEGFYVTACLIRRYERTNEQAHLADDLQKGKVRFSSPGRGYVDAGPGELVTVPVRLPHKFSNPFDEEAVFINTITPGFFVRYFAVLEELIGDGKTLTKEVNMEALKRFATVPLTEQMVKQFEDFFENKAP